LVVFGQLVNEVLLKSVQDELAKFLLCALPHEQSYQRDADDAHDEKRQGRLERQ
jgi:hypothetical protein